MQDKFKDELSKLLKNNKMLLVVLLIAILILVAIKIVTPTSLLNEPEPKAPEVYPTIGKASSSVWRDMEKELESELSKFLSSIKDCGRVSVMIRISKDESKIRAIDEDRTENITEEVDSTGLKRTTKEVRVVQKTVQESSSSGYKTVWLEMEAPVIEGVIVAATGAKDVKVKAILIEAVSTYFNIPAYKISVMTRGN